MCIHSLNGHNLEQVHQEKDLGVIVDDQLKFHNHTSTAVNKSNQILAIIKKSFMHLDMVTSLYFAGQWYALTWSMETSSGDPTIN